MEHLLNIQVVDCMFVGHLLKIRIMADYLRDLYGVVRFTCYQVVEHILVFLDHKFKLLAKHLKRVNLCDIQKLKHLDNQMQIILEETIFD